MARKACLTALLVTLIAAAGCTSSAAGGAPRAEPSLGAVPRLLDSAALRLPVEDYLPTGAQIEHLGTADLLAIQRCMARFGFRYPIPPTHPGQYGPLSLTDRRYGITDRRLAQRAGYGLAERDPARQPRPARPALSAAGETVLSGAGRSLINGRQVPDGGCIGEADRLVNRTIPGTVDVHRGDRLQLASFRRSKADSRVLAVFRSWSSCMAGSGYHYADPLAAISDPAFAAPADPARPADPAQIAVALADIACKERTNLVGVWFTVDAAYQRQAITADRATFERIRVALATRDAALISVIG